MATKKTNAAPLAADAAKDVTETMQTFSAWLTEQTGYKVDARSVQLGSALRAKWQAEVRAEKQAALDSITVPAKRAPRARKDSTIAATGRNGKPVVIAEQRHVEVA
jgi:hypothetical protein